MSPGEAEFPLCNDLQHSSHIGIDPVDDFTQAIEKGFKEPEVYKYRGEAKESMEFMMF